MHILTKIVDAVDYVEEKVPLTKEEILQYKKENPNCNFYPTRVLQQVEKVIKEDVKLRVAIYDQYTISEYLSKDYEVDKEYCILTLNQESLRVLGSFDELTKSRKVGYGSI